jgi:two-component system chemotaxis response regulator CheB
VSEVLDGRPTERGHVYLAPADYHLLVDRNHLSLSLDGPQSHARPSIDALFETAAQAFGAGVIAVLLTASSDDGVEGLVAVRAAGGLSVVQSPASARSPHAPEAAIARGAADHVVPLDEIAPLLRRLVARQVGTGSG